MPSYIHRNRHGEAYTIHAHPGTSGRSPRYVMRKTEHGGLAKLPSGYEVRETIHGQVSIRRKRKPAWIKAEERLIREAVKRHHAAGYALQIDGSTGTIFASAQDRATFTAHIDDEFAEGFESALAEKLPGRFTAEMREMFRERRQAAKGKRRKYYPLIRFVLHDKKSRLFRIERVCLTGESGWLRLEILPLPAALMKYVSRLGTDDLFELF